MRAGGVVARSVVPVDAASQQIFRAGSEFIVRVDLLPHNPPGFLIFQGTNSKQSYHEYWCHHDVVQRVASGENEKCFEKSGTRKGNQHLFDASHARRRDEGTVRAVRVLGRDERELPVFESPEILEAPSAQPGCLVDATVCKTQSQFHPESGCVTHISTLHKCHPDVVHGKPV